MGKLRSLRFFDPLILAPSTFVRSPSALLVGKASEDLVPSKPEHVAIREFMLEADKPVDRDAPHGTSLTHLRCDGNSLQVAAPFHKANREIIPTAAVKLAVNSLLDAAPGEIVPAPGEIIHKTVREIVPADAAYLQLPCTVHGGDRTVGNLVDDGCGGMRCGPSSQCRLAGTSFTLNEQTIFIDGLIASRSSENEVARYDLTLQLLGAYRRELGHHDGQQPAKPGGRRNRRNR